MRKDGLTIDSLRSCDVVTADDEYLVVDEDHHPELFWGLRGGGSNFGIVTSFEFDLHPVGPIMYAGLIAWPMQDAPSVLSFIRDFIEDAPDEIGVMANLRIAPPAPFIPERLHGTAIIALLVCYAGTVTDGETALAPLRRFGRPVIDALGAQPYVALQRSVDASVPHGNHYYWKAWRLPRLTDDLIATITEHACKLATPLSAVPIFCQSGAVARVDDDATAYPHRNAPHDINILSSWLPDDPDPDRHREWARTFYEALARPALPPGEAALGRDGRRAPRGHLDGLTSAVGPMALMDVIEGLPQKPTTGGSMTSDNGGRTTSLGFRGTLLP
jgi:FAD/FMN-containing dehydrogenase